MGRGRRFWAAVAVVATGAALSSVAYVAPQRTVMVAVGDPVGVSSVVNPDASWGT